MKQLILVGSVVWWWCVAAAGAAEKEARQPTFEQDVLPVLKAKCLGCHSGQQPKAGLNLSSRQGVLRGGRSGAAIRRGAAESSLLWERIAAGEMPLKGPPLTIAEKGIIRTWINEGAVGQGDGEDHNAAANDDFDIADDARQFWSFQPPRKAALPTLHDASRVQNPVDAFVVQRLQDAGLTLSREADRATLIRRAYFDLLGLPPTPEAIQSFQADPRPDAYPRMIERLLASPAYGERWGRHWLDVAGYADSAGILWEDRQLPLAFRYRDYVIAAWNKDKPYDRFLQEQIAGDELVDYWHHYEHDDALSAEIIEAITATGFLRCAPDPSRPDFKTIKNADAQYYYPTINDTMQIVSTSIMGLTLQCARCHNHMFDPISQQDFYQVQAVFMGAYRPTNWIPQMERRLTTLSKSQETVAKKRNAEIQANVKKLEESIAKLRDEYQARRLADQLAKLSEDIREAVRKALATPADKRNAAQRDLAAKHAGLQPDDKQLAKLLPAEYPEFQESLAKLNEQIAAERSRWYYYDEIRALYDLPGEVPTPFLRRGDALTPAHHVAPGALSIFRETLPFDWQPPAESTRTSGRRLAFARWLTDPQHPLTARVIVNRLWRQHFGQGIVATPDDFGRAGELPSHPELLDWLAVELIESGWSLKHLQRLILTSSTYRQSSAERPDAEMSAALAADPENRLLWRQRMRRLEAEAVRDAVLQVAGTLNTQMFGTPVATYRWANGEVTVANGSDPRRRSVYIQNRRLYPLTMLNAFDQPVMETNCIVRSRSTVSTQALTLLNSEAMNRAAEAFSERVLREDADDPPGRAVWLAFGRAAGDDERQLLTEFLSSQQARHQTMLEESADASEARRRAVTDMCHMLLSANEFIYFD